MNTENKRKTSVDRSTHLATADLSRIMTLTLPQVGMDRMTLPRVEETLACSALTAHY
jgi:hypothetical protein